VVGWVAGRFYKLILLSLAVWFIVSMLGAA
jgi:hypothetical protein